MLAFVLIILGVFIYNLRQPKRGIKDSDDDEREMSTQRSKKKKNDQEEEDGQPVKRERSEGSIFRGLRGLLESQTYEMSEGGEVVARHEKRASAKNQPTVSRIASKLVDQLPQQVKPKPKTGRGTGDFPCDGHQQEVKELMGGGPKSHVVVTGRTSSSGSESTMRSNYGSIDKQFTPPRTLTSDDEPERGKRDSLPKDIP